jgi:hypothetical protein
MLAQPIGQRALLSLLLSINSRVSPFLLQQR